MENREWSSAQSFAILNYSFSIAKAERETRVDAPCYLC